MAEDLTPANEPTPEAAPEEPAPATTKKGKTAAPKIDLSEYPEGSFVVGTTINVPE